MYCDHCFACTYFHHVDYVSAQYIQFLVLVNTVTFSFSTLECLLMLYFAVFRHTLEYTAETWNSIPYTDANKQERIQRNYAAPHRNRVLPTSIIVRLMHQNTQNCIISLMRCPFINVYLGLNFFPFLWDAKVPCKDCLIASCPSGANLDCRHDVFGEQMVLFNHNFC